MSAPARPRTVLGFDFGRLRIGVAVGQELTGTATPLVTLAARDGQPDWDGIARLLAEWQPALLVVGVPRHADGSDSNSTAQALRFARRLHGRFGLAVETIDERLSSHAAAERIATSATLRRRGRQDRAARDRYAAALILESWFHHAQAPQPCTTSSE